MMKGRSTLIVKANTISSKAAYVNTAAAWWWMSCKWCQHLFLTMMRDTQPQWSHKHSDTLVHISPNTVVHARVLVAFSLFDCSYICASIHNFTISSELCIFRRKWPVHVAMGYPRGTILSYLKSKVTSKGASIPE